MWNPVERPGFCLVERDGRSPAKSDAKACSAYQSLNAPSRQPMADRTGASRRAPAATNTTDRMFM